MTIWILAVVMVAIAVSAGYAQGAIMGVFSLVGIVAGVFLAMPLSPMVTPILPLFGITSTVTQSVIGPIVAFFLVGIAFKVAGKFVHRKVEYHYKYRLSDGERALWERMNRRVGASLGSIGGAIYFLMICLLVTVLGYFTTQVGASESSSTLVRFFNRMAEDVRDTRMDKVVGGLSPAPQSYYETCDLIGFLAQNRDVFKRMRMYPPLYAQGSAQYLDNDAEKSRSTALRGIADDEQYFKMLGTETDPSLILEHVNTQAVLTNAEVRAFVASLDVNDLMTYLKTGRSPKYSEEKILGQWVYNFPASLVLAKREKPNMLASDLIRYRREMEDRFDQATLYATLNNVFTIKLPSRMENTPIPGVTNSSPRSSYTGAWKKSGSGYTLDLHSRSGNRVETGPLRVEKASGRSGGSEVDRMTFSMDGKTVCFDRIPE